MAMIRIVLCFVLVPVVAQAALLDELRKAQKQLGDTQLQIQDTSKSLQEVFHAVADPANKDAVTAQFATAAAEVDEIVTELAATWQDLRLIQDSDKKTAVQMKAEYKQGFDVLKPTNVGAIASGGWWKQFGSAVTSNPLDIDTDVFLLQAQKKLINLACISDVFDVLPFIIEKPLGTIKDALNKLHSNFEIGAAGLNPQKDPLGVYAKLQESSVHFGNAINRIQKLIDVLSRKK